jgi:phage gpG-like protein
MGFDNQNIHGADALLAKLQALKLYLKEDVPVIIGTEAVNHFKNNFQEEGFDGNKWDSRKTKRAGGTNGQKILTFSGELSESIDFRIEGDTIVIYSDKPYAEIHNEGGIITLTDKQKKFFWAKHKEAKDAGDTDMADQYKAFALSKQLIIKQRKFMGESKELLRKIIERVKRDLNHILNS